MKRMLALLLALMLLPMGAVAETTADYSSLNEAAKPYGFFMGGCMSYGHLRDKAYQALLTDHFGSITATNEMKAYSLLNHLPSRLSKDGMPVMDYSAADRMVAWAQENGLKVRGHVLVWDAYMTDWFFREDYHPQKGYADKETMRRRVAYYIRDVITHFETKFPGVVNCWDVVNEAVADNSAEWVEGDPRHLRKLRSGSSNLFLDHVGDDYVEYAFLCARDTVEELGADIRLFYNDYNAFYPEKSQAIENLVKSINSYATDASGAHRTLIDGVGMQGYVGGYGSQSGCMNPGDITRIKESILAYGALGCEVQLTEMALRNYEADKLDKHADFYASLFRMLKTVNTAESAPFTGVTIWGLTDCNSLPRDNYSWKLNSPYGGLVDEAYAPKPAFAAVHGELTAQ